MSKQRLFIPLALLCSLCTATGAAYAGDDSIIGTGVGAAIGGLFGSQFGHGTSQLVSTGLGVAAGGLIGNNVGGAMDAESRGYGSGGGYQPYTDPAPVAYNYAPTYVAPPAPPPIYVDNTSGTYCRPYSQEIRIAGHVQESYGTACLQPDGSWRIMPQ